MTVDTLANPEEAVTEKQPKEQCTHYWLIDPPDGPISKGVCKICGAERDFTNYVS